MQILLLNMLIMKVKEGGFLAAPLLSLIVPWQNTAMIDRDANQKLSQKVIEALMIETLLLNDEVRSYFEGQGRDDRFTLQPIGQVTHSVEALKATTRLMHISAWLMSRRSRADARLRTGRHRPRWRG